MFIKISWKNSKGEALNAYVESTKVQGFINTFVERGVEPSLTMPESVVQSQVKVLTLS
tara:strand:- start:10234 stop:10407 length:174 start_codon:yes stop_codon:yes gene_type:complete